jgi:nucleoside recognition membrane protein YjiH
MTPLNHQLLGVVVVIVLLGLFGLIGASFERMLSEVERPHEPIELIPPAIPDQYRAEYAALLTLLRRMREEVKREGDRDSKSPVTHSAR